MLSLLMKLLESDRLLIKKDTPHGTRLVTLFALDSVGLLASVAKRVLLHQKMPTARQISFWDRLLVPLSRIGDPLICYSYGKSLIAVWQKALDTPTAGCLDFARHRRKMV